jgi:hypothetical protein
MAILPSNPEHSERSNPHGQRTHNCRKTNRICQLSLPIENICADIVDRKMHKKKEMNAMLLLWRDENE